MRNLTVTLNKSIHHTKKEIKLLVTLQLTCTRNNGMKQSTQMEKKILQHAMFISKTWFREEKQKIISFVPNYVNDSW